MAKLFKVDYSIESTIRGWAIILAEDREEAAENLQTDRNVMSRHTIEDGQSTIVEAVDDAFEALKKT